MALITTDLFGHTVDKVQRSIDRIKAFEPSEGYFLCFSGGKDSIVIKRLAELAGVKFDAHYSVTTVDPPELTHFIRDEHPDVTFDKPELSMRQLIIKARFPPTRVNRYCCAKLKETQGKGRVTMTGTRWAESPRRRDNQGLVTIFSVKKGIEAAEDSQAKYRRVERGGIVMNTDNAPERRTVELCYRTSKTLVNPIIDWEDEDVWEFIRAEHIPYCSLYDEGKARLGCIGCPMAEPQTRKLEFERWPFMYRMYLHAFADMLKARQDSGKIYKSWVDAEDVMAWWLHDTRKARPIDGQIGIEEAFDDGV